MARSRTTCQHVKPAESTNRVKERKPSSVTKHLVARGRFVAVDIFELSGKSYVVTVDYFSDFFEFDHLWSTSSVYVIKKLKGHFARHSIPEQLVTDNGPRFVSCDFLKFPKSGILSAEPAVHMIVSRMERLRVR